MYLQKRLFFQLGNVRAKDILPQAFYNVLHPYSNAIVLFEKQQKEQTKSAFVTFVPDEKNEKFLAE